MSDAERKARLSLATQMATPSDADADRYIDAYRAAILDDAIAAVEALLPLVPSVVNDSDDGQCACTAEMVPDKWDSEFVYLDRDAVLAALRAMREGA